MAIQIESIPEVANPQALHEWIRNVGPKLLRLSKDRELTKKESATLKAVKLVCPCHWTDKPRDFAENGENCCICGRWI